MFVILLISEALKFTAHFRFESKDNIEYLAENPSLHIFPLTWTYGGTASLLSKPSDVFRLYNLTTFVSSTPLAGRVNFVENHFNINPYSVFFGKHSMFMISKSFQSGFDNFSLGIDIFTKSVYFFFLQI